MIPTQLMPIKTVQGKRVSTIRRLRDIFIRPEPALPREILGTRGETFRHLPLGATVCIKVSCANDIPYPFAVSGAFVAQVVAEMRHANPALRILLTEGGVGARSVLEMAERHGLTEIPHTEFVDAEAEEPIFVPNPNPTPYQAEGFWLPAHWVNAEVRMLLTTCKVRSHHFQRWYSGGTRNLIGLLPRSGYKLASSRREMRSMLHQRGMDAMVADLYATAGKDVLTILDGRLLARHDEHLPLRFTQSPGKILILEDPSRADEAMVTALRLPFIPPYLAMITNARSGRAIPAPNDIRHPISIGEHSTAC